MNNRACEVLEQLMQGNRRFCSGQSNHYRYADDLRAQLAVEQKPIAAVVTCADSRVVPEVFFDQPLGTLFVSRVPANVASDSAKWMIDIAVGEFHVPLLLVLGHTGCLAVKQVFEGKSGPGGLLRFRVQSAVFKAQMLRTEDPYRTAIVENAKQTVAHLGDESSALRDALRLGTTTALAGVYNMHTGQVELEEG